MVLGAVLGLHGRAAARRFSFQDIIVAGARFAQIVSMKQHIGSIAKQFVVLSSETKAARDYSVTDLSLPVCDTIGQSEKDDEIIADKEAERNRLSALPLAIAARKAAESTERGWLHVAKTSQNCKTQINMVKHLVVLAKVLIQITFDVWKERCCISNEPDRKFFEDVRLLGKKILGRSILSLTLSEIIGKVFVEASFRDLSDDEKSTVHKFWCRIKKDLASVVFAPEYRIAEAESLMVASPENPWTPPVNVPVLSDPKFGSTDKAGAKKRRACVKFIVYAERAYQQAEAMIPYGYPEDRLLDLPLAVLCLSPSEVDIGKYDFLMSTEIQSKAVSLLSKSGHVTRMLQMLDTKSKSFNNNYEFIDIAPDLRNGTNSALDLVTAFLDAASGGSEGDFGEAQSGEDANGDHESDVDGDGVEVACVVPV